jgi:uncharacterized protein
MRHWLKKWLPDHKTLHHEKSLSGLSWLTRHTFLWHLNRQTVARGVASGLLVAFLPLPLQMLLAAILAFLFRANLPIAVVTTWISNPITFVPINYLIYKIGVLITQADSLNSMPQIHELTPHWKSLSLVWSETIAWIGSLGQTYIIGLIIISLGSAAIGYCLTYLMWTMSVRGKWQTRKNKSKNNF